ncbi:MAG: class I SAM-dependent methyltransferase [Bacteroidales bacterium]|nr:class I SAM-dependent methyltransferase [Bacteroidales bacterium]
MPYREIIASAYDLGVEEEMARLDSSPLCEAEHRLMLDLLDEYVPQGATVFDIGSGPGRYAEYLLKRHCHLGLVDLSVKSLDVFAQRIGCFAKERLMFSKVSCASSLDWIPSQTADAVLMMGPLYHLTNARQRNQALAHAMRILKPGGKMIAVFLSPFPLLLNEKSQGHTPLFTECCAHHPGHQDEMVTHVVFQGYNVPQYRCWPYFAEKLLIDSGFETICVKNIEGVASLYSSERLKNFALPDQKKLLYLTLSATASDEQMLGLTHQFVIVARTPQKEMIKNQ